MSFLHLPLFPLIYYVMLSVFFRLTKPKYSALSPVAAANLHPKAALLRFSYLWLNSWYLFHFAFLNSPSLYFQHFCIWFHRTGLQSEAVVRATYVVSYALISFSSFKKPVYKSSMCKCSCCILFGTEKYIIPPNQVVIKYYHHPSSAP